MKPRTPTILIALCCAAMFAHAQPASTNAPRRFQQGPQVISPEVLPDRRITFRILAPKAESVRVSAGDIPNLNQNDRAQMTKGTNGVWEVTVGPVPPGAFRYNFNVDGTTVIDPRNPATSESNANTWSLVTVPGSDFQDLKNVPHGAVAEVTYYSQSLKRFRRMHVYTPPGYESGKGKFPTFYLLHGASDSDASWSTVGRAGIIVDNLIATKKAKPMIVVMPAGHTSRTSGPRSSDPSRRTDEFVDDFENDILPYIEKHYRVGNSRGDRAIAGLSMGGAQTLNIGARNLEKFAYLGVYSSGVFGINSRTNTSNATWEQQHAKTLDDAKLKKGLKLVWFATGKDDFLIETSRATVQMLKKHGFDVTWKETDGGHTWLNWRDYLNEFTPLLFQ
jgi:enterochelin esterase-like enzyme